ncbi:unnamed protein product, partial [Dovyalis caffra]
EAHCPKQQTKLGRLSHDEVGARATNLRKNRENGQKLLKSPPFTGSNELLEVTSRIEDKAKGMDLIKPNREKPGVDRIGIE